MRWAAGFSLVLFSAAGWSAPLTLVCEQTAGGQTEYRWDADAGTLNGHRNHQREPYGTGSYQQYFVDGGTLGRGVYTESGQLVYEFRASLTDGRYLFWDPNSHPEGPTLIGKCAPLKSGDAPR